MQLQRRNRSRNGGDRSERRTYVTHKPILQQLQPVVIVCLLVFVFLFPHAKNCAFIFLTHTQVRLFLTCGSPCVCSTSDCAVLLRSRRTKRSDIIREMAQVMSRPSVVPPATRSPWVPFQGGTVIWARRVKQFVRWTDCSQSEQGGLPRKRRSPNT